MAASTLCLADSKAPLSNELVINRRHAENTISACTVSRNELYGAAQKEAFCITTDVNDCCFMDHSILDDFRYSVTQTWTTASNVDPHPTWGAEKRRRGRVLGRKPPSRTTGGSGERCNS